MRASLPPVRDQGPRGTCLAFTVTACHESERTQGKSTTVDLSEECLYWGARQVSSLPSGVTFASVTTALDHWGQPEAHCWPYDASRDEADGSYHPPSAAILAKNCFRANLGHLTVDVTAFEESLKQGRPIVLVIKLSLPFYSAPGGRVALPIQADIINDHHAVVEPHNIGVSFGRS